MLGIDDYSLLFLPTGIIILFYLFSYYSTRKWVYAFKQDEVNRYKETIKNQDSFSHVFKKKDYLAFSMLFMFFVLANTITIANKIIVNEDNFYLIMLVLSFVVLFLAFKDSFYTLTFTNQLLTVKLIFKTIEIPYVTIKNIIVKKGSGNINYLIIVYKNEKRLRLNLHRTNMIELLSLLTIYTKKEIGFMPIRN